MSTIGPWYLPDGDVYHFRDDCNRGGENLRDSRRVDGTGRKRPCEECFVLLASEFHRPQ